MIEVSALGWMLLFTATLVVGMSKTAFPGANTVAVVLFATALPTRPSTAALLLVLLIGDAFALLSYRRQVDFPTLLRLLPAVAVGIVVGYAFFRIGDDALIRRVIGAMLFGIMLLTLWGRRHQAKRVGPVIGSAYGAFGGFTTMVANAGGPVISMYFLAARTPVKAFLGTSAWFFAIVNLTKVPFLASLGLFTPTLLLTVAILVPGVALGAIIGRTIAKRVPQRVFDRIIVTLTLLGALYLLR